MNTLIISDLHIASGATLPNKNCLPTNKGLLDFLEYYSNNRINNEPWTLIINGDAIDFMSAVVLANAETEVSLDDRLHGLHSTVEKTEIKLRIIMEHFHDFFASLAKFVSIGNQLKIITGNHDLEFSFKEIQALFIEELSKLATSNYDIFVKNINFHSWFYYEPGILYAEHGHQYDEYCSTDYSLSLMHEEKDIVHSISHLGMRYFVSKIPHYNPYNAEEWGFYQYLKWAYNLGVKKALYSLTHYIFLVYKTILLWSKLRRTEEERKFDNDLEIGYLANSNNIRARKLRKLYYLRCMPVTRSLFKLASTYFIDRMLLITIAIVGMIYFAVHLQHHWKATIPGIVLIAGYLLNEVFNKIRFNAPNNMKLRSAAQKVNQLMPAKLITFGHTHSPEVIALKDGATYINSGGWTEDGRYTYILITKDTYELKYWTQ